MRITIVTGPFLPIPPGNAGAVEKIWAKLAEEFAKNGHEVTVVSRKNDGCPSEITENGVRKLRRSGFSYTGRMALDKLLDLCYAISVLRAMPAAEITVTNTFFLPVLTSRFRRFGQIVVSMERYPKGQLRLYSKCGRVRTPSKAVLEAGISQHPRAASVLKVIPNPVDLETFVPRKEPRQSPSRGTILYTGRIHPEKGIHILVQAFRILHAEYPNLSLVLIGPQEHRRGGGGSEYVTQLKSLSGGLPLDIRPAINNPKELAGELQRASIYCYPSIAEKGESFGVSPLEAMATGLPVVVSKLAVFEEFIEDGQTGLVFDHRSNAPEIDLASKIRRLIQDEDLWRKLELKGASAALNFGYPRIAESFLDDFNILVQTFGDQSAAFSKV